MTEALKKYFDDYFYKKQKINELLFNTSSDELKYEIIEQKEIPISFTRVCADKGTARVFLENRSVYFGEIFSVDLKTAKLTTHKKGTPLKPTPYGWYYGITIPYGPWAGYEISERDGHHYITDNTPLAGRCFDMETGKLLWMS